MCECFQLQLGCVSSTDLSHLVEYGRHLATPIVYRRSGVCRDKWTPGANSLIDAPHLPAYSCLSMHIFQLDAHLHKKNPLHARGHSLRPSTPPSPHPTPPNFCTLLDSHKASSVQAIFEIHQPLDNAINPTPN